MMLQFTRTIARCAPACWSFVFAVALARPASAQWSTTHHQFYRQASHNWEFRRNYPAADRLFNAFDYGHAILYETLWTAPTAPVARLEERQYDFITRRLLVNPPRVPLEESAIEVEYAKLVPEAKEMFDWAHVLHRQVYDVWADDRLSVERKDQAVRQLLSYYLARRDVAFSTHPKDMDLMEGQPYSLAFRRRYPKFNGLIWAYHWLQVGLYEPLLTGKTSDARRSGINAALARFRQMLEEPPRNMPKIMPMTAADRARVFASLSGGRDHLRQPARDARRHLRRARRHDDSARPEARGDSPGRGAVSGRLDVDHDGGRLARNVHRDGRHANGRTCRPA